MSNDKFECLFQLTVCNRMFSFTGITFLAIYVLVTYIDAFKPGIKMACATFLFLYLVSSNLQVIFMACLSSDLYLSGNLGALPLYVLAVNNFRLRLASKRKKIQLIPYFQVL